jgi:ubiquitin carboxyl-terminal hydrolase 14
LVVQQIRFIWKGEDKGTQTEARKAKILRSVNFPMMLDMDLYCSEDLRNRLAPNRAIQKERDDKKIEREKAEFEVFKNERMNDEDMDTLKITQAFKKLKKASEVKEFDDMVYREFGTGIETGEYNLVGVITHKGRSADSGHYLGWTHHSGGKFIKFSLKYLLILNRGVVQI